MTALALAVGACTGDDGEDARVVERAALVDHALWQQAAVDDDPFADRRPAGSVCDPLGIRPEWLGPDPVLEVDTGTCDFVTVVQPSLAELLAGDTVDVRLWHYDLFAPDPATGYAAVAIGHELVWSYEVAIPGDAHLASDAMTIEHDAPVGTPVYFFVGNHGLNQWGLIDVDRAANEDE